MTQVYIEIEPHENTRARVTATFTPTAIHTHGPGKLGDMRAFSRDITGGRMVSLEPTELWLWRIQIQGMGVDLDGYYTIPDKTSHINYSDLEKVDPSTMPNPAAPQPAWWVALSEAVEKAGSRWFNGNGKPTQNGKPGDYYLDNTTGKYYMFGEN